MLKVFVANSFSFNGSLAVFLSVLGKYLKSAIVESQWDVMRCGNNVFILIPCPPSENV